MKRIIILAVIGLCISGISVAQGQKLKGRLIDKDHYPVRDAKVTVKGTDLSTTSDKNGDFSFENVPLSFDSVRIEKGRKDVTVATPMKISMGRKIIDGTYWFVKAGVGLSRFLGADDIKNNVGFHIGGGIDIKLAKHWSFQPAAYIAYRELEANMWSYEQDYTNYKMTYLEIPLLFAYKFRLNSSLNWVISLGPYMDCGIKGDGTTVLPRYNNNGTYSNERVGFDIFGKRFTGGAAYGMGIESNRFLIGFTGRTGWTSWESSEGFTNVEFEIGYKF